MSEWNTETAEWYAEKYGEYATNRLAIDALELAPDEVVVDVGCGAGSALRRAASRVTSGRLLGVDPVPRMLEIAKERALDHPEGHRIEFAPGTAETIPLEDGSATVVLAFDSFDHWTDKEAGLREVLRVLAPGGRLVVVKDGGVPAADSAGRSFVDQIRSAGFAIATEQALAEGDVSFAMWICSPSGG